MDSKKTESWVQFNRSHVDIMDPNLTVMKTLIRLRDELKDIVTIQLVAFPQEEDTYRAIRERVEVLASICNGEYLFKREPRTNEVEIDFLKQ